MLAIEPMHEMALAQSVVDLVTEHSRRDSFARARSIHLSIGALSVVDPRALEFGFEVVARGTVAEGARLVIDRPGGRAFCIDCSRDVAIGGHGEPCPLCGGARWILVGGNEMRVVDLEVE